jgi:hypothetical protein
MEVTMTDEITRIPEGDVHFTPPVGLLVTVPLYRLDAAVKGVTQTVAENVFYNYQAGVLVRVTDSENKPVSGLKYENFKLSVYEAAGTFSKLNLTTTQEMSTFV